MSMIDNSKDLEALCKRLAKHAYVTVDTEFMRDKTYWPILCLVQVASEEEACCIDPLAKDMDLAPLHELFRNKDVLKVFHSARQDLEIFFYAMKGFPEPIFDTQVAAMVCGYGDSVGYETLVHRLTDGRLDKSSRFTDWARRPLTKRQLDYALGDVVHLRTVYAKLADQLAKSGRQGWLAEEMATLTDPATYVTEPAEAWQKLKARSTSKRFLGVLKCVAAWRQREAETRDLPRNRIARDEVLLEIAAHPPESKEDLKTLRSLPRGFEESRHAQGLLDAVREGIDLKDSDLPVVKKQKPMSAQAGPLLELLKVLLKAKSTEHGVAQKLVATTADLEEIVTQNRPETPALHGWRREVFGKDAVLLKKGKVALSARGDRIVLVPLGDKTD